MYLHICIISGDVKVIAISYILMTFYIMFALGKVSSTTEKWYSCDIRHYISEKKFSLSIFGVILVILSVAASIGLFGLIGIPSTIVSFQVLPFLVSNKWNLYHIWNQLEIICAMWSENKPCKFLYHRSWLLELITYLCWLNLIKTHRDWSMNL